jgi:16S rRNA (adenine1518-N6/adenine1519-N6)-dimethyltransferase
LNAPGGRPHRAKKSLGQNFLIDPNLQRKIIAAVDAGPEDEVLEIGPGRGALTRHLIGACRRLILVELDDHLSARLQDAYRDRSDVVVIHADFLKTDLDELSRDPSRLKVVGNIPYNVTAPIVFKLLGRPRPASIVLMVQREVAMRMAADPGTSDYGALSVGVQTVADVTPLFKVPRTAFRPVPRVESTVVRLVPHNPPSMSTQEEAALRALTRAAFGWRRKQFQRILRDHPSYRLKPVEVQRIERAFGHSLTRRPETFAPSEFLRLSQLLAADSDNVGPA